MTPSPTAFLQEGMKPFKLRIDWSCHESYGDPVAVELHIMDEDPVVLSEQSSVPRAVDFALHWLPGRGFDFWCNIDLHQRSNHTHITLHPRPLNEPVRSGAASDG